MAKNYLTTLAGLILLAVVLAAGCSGPAIAETGDTVRVHYTGRLADGTVFDTSAGGEPLEFTLGQGNVIPGFEEAVIGMQVGATKTVVIPTDQAYGQRQEDLVFEVGRDELPADIDPVAGMQLQMNQGDGSITIVTITEVSETTITIDANHFLAGQSLTFDIELVEIMASQSKTDSGLTSIPLVEALANGKPTLAEFGSNTCLPCKQMKPILEELAVEYEGELNVAIIEVYDNMELSREYGIMAIPTQVFFAANGKEVSRHTGFFAKEDILYELKSMGVE
jgi:peptidylprolyl isomerase